MKPDAAGQGSFPAFRTDDRTSFQNNSYDVRFAANAGGVFLGLHQPQDAAGAHLSFWAVRQPVPLGMAQVSKRKAF